MVWRVLEFTVQRRNGEFRRFLLAPEKYSEKSGHTPAGLTGLPD
jgi:hypothetical protein